MKLHYNSNKMTKQISLILEHLNKADDTKYVEETIDAIIESLYDFTSFVTNIDLYRTRSEFRISYDLKICKTGDSIWMLCKEFLSCIRETEQFIDVTIEETEDNETMLQYKLYTYKRK